MSHPLVVHKRNPHDVFIGRPSKWGNPFIIGRDGEREQVIAKHAFWLLQQPELLAALPELKGKRLGCFCAPNSCHGDTLALIANHDCADMTTEQIYDMLFAEKVQQILHLTRNL